MEAEARALLQSALGAPEQGASLTSIIVSCSGRRIASSSICRGGSAVRSRPRSSDADRRHRRLPELMRPAPVAEVAAWFERQPLDRLAITAVTVGEILYGLDRLPDGRRKADLTTRFAAVVRRAPRPRPRVRRCRRCRLGPDRGDRERAGRPIGINDAMIAGIVRSSGVTVATRNVANFAGCGIAVLDPWAAAGS